MRKLFSIALLLSLLALTAQSEGSGLFVKRQDLPADFILGMDVSSAISLEQSGVTFKNFDGQEEDLFAILAENGFNHAELSFLMDSLKGATVNFDVVSRELGTIKSMDKAGRVIYVGSYSKILSPGIRVGLVLAPKNIIQKIVVAKQVSDVHTNLFFMMIVAEFIKRYDIDAHISKIRQLYTHKRDTMLAAIEQCFDKRIYVEKPDGGLFLWCELPRGYDGAELCRLAGTYKVAAVPGVSFETDESRVSPGFRLNFSLPTDEQINTGIEFMGRAITTYLG